MTNSPRDGTVTTPLPETPVDLDNCAQEPIHIPGLIQPHGVLLAFGADGRLQAHSVNATLVLAQMPALGAPLNSLDLPAEVRSLIEDFCRELPQAGQLPPVSLEEEINGASYDVVVHGNEGHVIAEFERRAESLAETASFALKAHRGLDLLKRQRDVQALLDMAVTQVRAITGFDRVMAYRFRHDDSGDVAAEARDYGIDSFLGMRYPASDIPAQARRLYTINSLRLIADTDYQPVAVRTDTRSSAVDMSHSILRSVSPIHVEYLHNMGVRASMSVSIVVGGRLWGMLACHHYKPVKIPYSIRMACDVLAQVLAATVQTLETQARMERLDGAGETRARVVEVLSRDYDPLNAFAEHERALRESLNADALLIHGQGKTARYGDITATEAAAVCASLDAHGGTLQMRWRRDEWPADARTAIGDWVGMLALHFDPLAGIWLVALRREQIHTVRWAGDPKKHIVAGPLGPRLTPRGSFAEWKETVRDTAEPWTEVSQEIAQRLLADLTRISGSHHSETERTRLRLLAVLGHDLRDPLQAIAMAAQVIERGVDERALSRRIQASTSRMQRLIGQVLDLSRMDAGLDLGLNMQTADLRSVIEDLVAESRIAYPGASYEINAPLPTLARIDADRMSQVVGNLISNARHHGEPGVPIRIHVGASAIGTAAAHAYVRVKNSAPPIDDLLVGSLFQPFKRASTTNQRNRTGLGLGLHIAKRLADAHGGSLEYRYEEPYVVFEVKLPLVV